MAKRILPIILLGLLALIWVLNQPNVKNSVTETGRLGVHFLDVGQGDSELLSLPGGEHILIDGGETDAGDEIMGYLHRLGVERLDLVVITHPHSDHIGGLARVLEEIPVSRVIDAGIPHGSMQYRSLLREIGDRKIPYETADDLSAPLVYGPVNISLLWPTGTAKGLELNDRSLVFRAVYGETSFLFAADIGEEAEARLMAEHPDIGSTVLKVAHHGSHGSTTDEFLQAVSPEYAVISVGAGNSYGHPSDAVLEKLRAVGARVFRTDIDGTVVMTSDGSTVQYE